MELENFILEKKGRIALLTINRPPANVWNWAITQEFERVLDDLLGDDQIRVVIITGAGELCFSAGFDVTDAANSYKTSPKGQELWRRVDRFPKPVIAAINGHALGGGCELAMCCHFRIMADSPRARIGLTELTLGIIPGWGGTQRMARLIGRPKALNMILFSQRATPQEALEMGLVDKVAPPEKLMEESMELATRLAERPPVAVRCVLEAMAAGMYEGLDKGLEMELQGSRIVDKTEDAKEGFTAFLEKRPPVFKGK